MTAQESAQGREVPGFLPEDNVVIYDDAGLPSVMVKISRPKDTEKIHPMFIIGGEVYDEIYISKYKNASSTEKPIACRCRNQQQM